MQPAGGDEATPARTAVPWRLTDLLLVIAVGAVVAVSLVGGFRVLRRSGVIGDGAAEHGLVIGLAVGAAIYLGMLAATWAFVVRRRGASWQQVGFRPPGLRAGCLLPVLFVGQMVALVVVQALVVAVIGRFRNPQTAAFTDPQGFSWVNLAVALVTVAVVAPVVEELLFRGLLYQWLRGRLPVAAAVGASATIFAGLHFIPVLLPALLLMGVVLALVFEYTRSLWMCIGLHMMQNAFAVSVMFWAQASGG